MDKARAVLTVLECDNGKPGYEIIKALENQRHIKVGLPTLYDLLRELEEGGFIRWETRPEHGRQRKYFFLTEAGRIKLNFPLPKS